MKPKTNVYVTAFKYECCKVDGIEKICKAIVDDFVVESTARCWLENGRTEKEIIKVLRKIGYDIPNEIVGSDAVYYG